MLLVISTEADGDTEVDVDTDAYLATRSAVTPEEDTDDDMEDVSIVKDAEEVADEDTSILTGSELQGACAFQALPLPGASQRSAPLPETEENQRRHLQRQRQHGVSIFIY